MLKKSFCFMSFVLSFIMVFNMLSILTYADSTANIRNDRSVDSLTIKELEPQTIYYTQEAQFNIVEDTIAAKEVVLVMDTSTSLREDLDSPLFDYNLLSGGTDDFVIEKSVEVGGNVHSNAGLKSIGISKFYGTCSSVKNVTITSPLTYTLYKPIQKTTRISTVDFSDKILNEINASSKVILNASDVKDPQIFHNNTIINGDVTLSGNINFANSKVYVNGDVTINARNYKGFGILVATGRITVEGTTFANNDAKSTNPLCLYSVNSDVVFKLGTSDKPGSLDYLGICYAPNGKVVFDSTINTTMFNGYIAANNIEINSSNFKSVRGADKMRTTLMSYIKLTRLDVLKNAASAFVEKFRGKNIRLSIIGFSSNANKEYGNSNKFELFSMAEDSNVNMLKNHINNIKTSSGTNIGDGLRRAYYLLTDDVKYNSNPDASKYIVLLTDGDPTCYSFNGSEYKLDDGDTVSTWYSWASTPTPPLSPSGYVQEIGKNISNEKTIIPFIVGFSNDAEDSELQSIADSCSANPVDSEGNNYYKALTSDAIYSVYDAIAIEILGGVKFRAEFTEVLPAEVKSVTCSNSNISIRQIDQSDVGTTINQVKIEQSDVGKYLLQGTLDDVIAQRSVEDPSIYTTEPGQDFDITVEYAFSALNVKYPKGKSVITYYAEFTDGNGIATGEQKALTSYEYESLDIRIEHLIDVN